MPNGFHGNKEHWDRIIQPLVEIDQELLIFAQNNKMNLSKNERNWPDRSLVRFNGEIRQLIQIYLDDEKTMSFNVWVCSSLDKGGKRYLKKEFLKKSKPFSEIKKDIDMFLENGLNLLESWTEEKLEPTT